MSLHALDGLMLVGMIAALVWARPSWAVVYPYTPAVIAVFLLSLNALSAYDPGDARRDRRRLLSGTALATLILACLTVFPPHVSLGFPFLLTFAAGGLISLVAGRKAADQLVRQVYAHGIGLRRAIIVGNLDDVGDAIRQIRDDYNIDQYLVGHLAPDDQPDPAALAPLSELSRIVVERDVQEVIIATALSSGEMRRVAEDCFNRGVLLYVIPSVLGTVDCRVAALRVGACPMFHLQPPRLEVTALLLKRVFDLILSLVALLILLPLVALIALAIKIDSPGPVFFRQQRVGMGGHLFTMWKFRSMIANSEAQKEALASLNVYGDHRLFKMPRDPRITRIGRVLRRTSLDELPQLLNVLIGDMSLVGPRPPLPTEVDAYEPHHFDRLTVMPGITGPWQVGGRNLVTDFEEVVRMERAYIRSWSLLLDVKILLRTVKVVLSGEGAY